MPLGPAPADQDFEIILNNLSPNVFSLSTRGLKGTVRTTTAYMEARFEFICKAVGSARTVRSRSPLLLDAETRMLLWKSVCLAISKSTSSSSTLASAPCTPLVLRSNDMLPLAGCSYDLKTPVHTDSWNVVANGQVIPTWNHVADSLEFSTEFAVCAFLPRLASELFAQIAVPDGTEDQYFRVEEEWDRSHMDVVAIIHPANEPFAKPMRRSARECDLRQCSAFSVLQDRRALRCSTTARTTRQRPSHKCAFAALADGGSNIHSLAHR